MPFPKLVFSQLPLRPDTGINHSLIINLGNCAEQDVEEIFDLIIKAIKTGDLQPLDELRSDRKPKRDRSEEFLKFLELKPNFFGVGVNFNHAIRKLSAAIKNRGR